MTRSISGSFRSSFLIYHCPHGKARNCEVCENSIDRELNQRIVQNNDIRVESSATLTQSHNPSATYEVVTTLNDDSLSSSCAMKSSDDEDSEYNNCEYNKSVIENTTAVTQRDGTAVTMEPGPN